MDASALDGRWSLITGASSGIGAAFVHAVAARGGHVALVARREDRLEALAGTCRRHGVQALAVPADLGEPGAAAAVAAAVHGRGLRIALLVNCAGADPWGAFESHAGRDYERLVQLLAGSPMALCRAFHADLRAERGAVVNVSSPAALQPMPWKAAYAAGKAALHHFSLGLRGEWAEQGILVQTLVPGPTATAIEQTGGAYDCRLRRGARDDPALVAEASLAGLADGRAVVATARRLWLQRWFAACAPSDRLLRAVGALARPPAARPGAEPAAGGG